MLGVCAAVLTGTPRSSFGTSQAAPGLQRRGLPPTSQVRKQRLREAEGRSWDLSLHFTLPSRPRGCTGFA